ncbi:glycoside hydrolase family 25 protein [Chelativorans intermedius]|uniref:Lysozyme n=1 Tax=Chelativorans intermedius TaxID=515947 RepID=A0ABV6D885_9HYPH|nr:glycoside hydrolase family 25 protein [Chelativorans intermedius]MCT8996856.1 glycoside hydrolase family 25 protein [Chelativorans intermedius]
MRLLTILLLIVLTACARVSYDHFADMASPVPASGGLRFADNDPHEWTDRPPWAYPVHGTDVSKYQGEVDWRRVAGSGISFAFIKATEGGDLVDETFARNWREARAAGIPRGAYHFFYFCRPAIEQARWFIRHVPREKDALPPVLDMEWNSHSPTCRRRPPPQEVRREMQIFLDAVERHYGRRPIIYTSVDFFDDNGLERFADYPFWLRSVAGHPDDTYADHPWVFWQYTGTGVVPGIEGDADINAFHGSIRAWRAWLAANAA